MKKIFTIILSFLVGLSLGIALYHFTTPTFGRLSLEEMQKQVIAQRDIGIENAIAAGVYNCCVDPPCTMCYMEANQWNNEKAGTCACDNLIAQGEEPCPQCKGVLAQSDSNTCSVQEERCD